MVDNRRGIDTRCVDGVWTTFEKERRECATTRDGKDSGSASVGGFSVGSGNCDASVWVSA